MNGTNSVGGLLGSSSTYVYNSYSNVSVNGINSVGGLIGAGNCDVNNSYATGNVNGSYRVGGLVGYNLYGNIENSYATGNVVGNFSVGGLIGYNEGANRYIMNSYSTGNVEGNFSVGGLVGYTLYTGINNSYSSGNVNGFSDVGGLVGLVNGGSGKEVRINNSFSVSTVNGSINSGGLIGNNSNSYSYVSDSYWNNNSQNPSVGIGFDFNSQSTFAIDDNISWFYFSSNSVFSNWDLSIWTFSNTSLPQLSWTNFESETIVSSETISSLFPLNNLISVLLVLFGVLSFLLFS